MLVDLQSLLTGIVIDGIQHSRHGRPFDHVLRLLAQLDANLGGPLPVHPVRQRQLRLRRHPLVLDAELVRAQLGIGRGGVSHSHHGRVLAQQQRFADGGGQVPPALRTLQPDLDVTVAVAGLLIVVLGRGDEGSRAVGAEIVPASRRAEHGVGSVGGFHLREADGTSRSRSISSSGSS